MASVGLLNNFVETAAVVDTLAMVEDRACPWCGLEIHGGEDWVRSDERRWHPACLRAAREFQALTRRPPESRPHPP
jgi:hypothetical protein